MYRIPIIFFALGLLGLYLSTQIPLRLNPTKAPPKISLLYAWNNASAYSVDRYVTSKLEARLSTISGIRTISSKSSNNHGIIDIEFWDDVDIKLSRFYVSNVIKELKKDLPENLTYPQILVNKSSISELEPVITISLAGEIGRTDIYEIAMNLVVPQLALVTGVDRVTVKGISGEELVVKYHPDKLMGLGVSVSNIINGLSRNENKESVGSIKDGNRLIPFEIESLYREPERIAFGRTGGKVFSLKDLANISLVERNPDSHYRINGANVTTLSIIPNNKENVIELSNEIRNQIGNIERELPDNVSLNILYDSSTYLNKEIRKVVKRSLYAIIALVLFILLVYRNYRYLITVITSALTTIAIAFIAYKVLSIELQLYSIAGMTISVGLILDNFILMTDHIYKSNDKRVIFPLLASSLTTIASLATIFFFEKSTVLKLIDFALIIAINLTISLVTAYFLLPILLQLLKVNKKNHQKTIFSSKLSGLYLIFLSKLLQQKSILLITIVLLFGIPFFMLPKQLNMGNSFDEFYNSTIGSSFYNGNIRPYVDKYLGGAFRLFSIYVFENSNYNTNQRTTLHVKAYSEKSGTLEQMNEALKSIERYLSNLNPIENYITNVYSSKYGTIDITFKPDFEISSFPYQLKTRLIKNSLDLGGFDWRITGVGKGFTNVESSSEPINYRIKIKGYDLDKINFWADSLKSNLKLSSRIRNVEIVENIIGRVPKMEYYQFKSDPYILGVFKLQNRSIHEKLAHLTVNRPPDLFIYKDYDYVPVKILSDESAKFDFWGIQHSPLTFKKTVTNLSNLGSVSLRFEDESIHKVDQEYVKIIELQYLGARKFGDSYIDKKITRFNSAVPLGFKYERIETSQIFSDVKSINYVPVIIVVILIIFYICSVLFESLYKPLIIISVVPISFIGVFLTFYFFNINLDMGGLACFILLSGLTVNSSILLVDEFNHLSKQDYSRNPIQLYVQAFTKKIGPILLMLLSSIFGLVPFLIDGQSEVFWFTLASGTIGGLLFSLIAILIYIPLLLLRTNSRPKRADMTNYLTNNQIGSDGP